jgi:SAM-dependent methyltransferase
MTTPDQFPISPPLPLPSGQTEASIKAFFGSIELEGAPKAEMVNYWGQDWRRFVYTLGLAQGLSGESLELGSNPYYTTLLVQHFTELRPTLANYFGDHFPAQATQRIAWNNPITGAPGGGVLPFFHFNIEKEDFPFADGQFDLVLFCEIIEHLQNDPVGVIRQIKRVLKPGGRLILTTPNVSRLENVGRIVAGENIYDPYSGYGPYGRHNREYNRHELSLLLDYCGFDIEVFFSADVHENRTRDYIAVSDLRPLVARRDQDLGQYLFVRATNTRPSRERRPSWLYRSYPSGELES